MKLYAELVEQEGFPELLLPETEGEWLVWSNEQGEVLGTGTEIEVQNVGVYYCKLVVSNEDVEPLEGSVQVVIKGVAY